MKRTLGICVAATCLLFFGCRTAPGDDGTYDEMLSDYTLYSVSNVWEAYNNNDTSVSGDIILVEGYVYSVDTDNSEVVLKDISTNKTITCIFASGSDYDPGSLEDYVNSTDYTVTIRGTCYFDTGSGYPYLGECDYYYVEAD
jgi:hypothetical protein